MLEKLNDMITEVEWCAKLLVKITDDFEANKDQFLAAIPKEEIEAAQLRMDEAVETIRRAFA